jgi:biuret amidohydrolase
MPSIVARPFAYPYNNALDPKATALLVIDLQADYLSPDGYFAKMGYDPTALRAILPTVNEVIHASRKAGVRIIHTRQGVRADLADMTSYGRWRRNQAGMSYEVLMRGKPGYEIVPEIVVANGDYIIDKKANGAFTGTDLELILRAQGITHLLFAGCTTDICVHSTMREASDRNFQCLLIEDACASGDPRAHDAAVYITTVENGLIGLVAQAKDVISGLRDLDK